MRMNGAALRSPAQAGCTCSPDGDIRASADPKLAEDTSDVRVRSSSAQPQPGCNLPVCESLGYQADDFSLSRAQMTGLAPSWYVRRVADGPAGYGESALRDLVRQVAAGALGLCVQLPVQAILE